LGWLAAVSLVVWAVFGLGNGIREYRAAERAVAGDGRIGTFTASWLHCSREGCFWHGTFTTDRAESDPGRGVRLRGPDHETIVQGRRVPAIDVGLREVVYATATPPTPASEAAAPLIFGSLAGLLGAAVILLVVRRTPWSRVRRRPRGRSVIAACRGWVRGILEPDRWDVSTWGRSDVRVRVIRSPWRTIAWGTAWPLFAFFAFGLLAMPLEELPRTVEFEDRLVLLWFPLLSVFLTGMAVQIGRLLVLRPRMRVTGDAILLRDSVLLWKTVRIRREDIAAVHHKTGGYLVPGRYAELTPFREEPNLHLLLRAERRLPGRHLRWGNWIWLVESRQFADRPRLPRRDETYRRISLRVRQPERTAEELRRRLGQGPSVPVVRKPRFQPTDHFMDGRSSTHHGVGDRTITIKGALPQPVVARISNDGPTVLDATLHQTEHGRGRALVSMRAGRAPVRVVLADGPRRGDERYLRIRASGSWTVTLSGPETAPEFDSEIHGEGADVVAYTGPSGIGVLTGNTGAAQVLLRRPDLTLEYGSLHAAPAVWHRWRRYPGSPFRAVFAVPAGAMLQISGEGDWSLKVLPLRLAPGTQDLLDGRGVNHLRTFEDSVNGRDTEVLLYTGPHTMVDASYKGKKAITIHRLDDAMAPSSTHVIAAGRNERIEVRPWTLLQVNGDGGTGRWHLRPSR